MFSVTKKQMRACTRTHTHTQKHKMPPLEIAFHFDRKLTGSEPDSVCVYVCVCVVLYGCHGVR